MKLRIVFAALLLLSAATSGWLSMRLGQQRERIAALESKLNLPSGPSQQAAAPVQEPPTSPAARPSAPPASHTPHGAAAVAPTCPDTASLNTKLQETAASLTQAHSRIADLEAQMETFARERRETASRGAQLESQIADLNQTIEAMHAERPQLTKRLRDAETEVERLRQQVQNSSQKNTQLAQLAADFKEIARRQQVYTTSILRRYREVTDLFRALPGVMEARGNGPEVTRIQTAISMADEDLRQLNELNTRMGRLQTQITAAIASR